MYLPNYLRFCQIVTFGIGLRNPPRPCASRRVDGVCVLNPDPSDTDIGSNVWNIGYCTAIRALPPSVAVPAGGGCRYSWRAPNHYRRSSRASWRHGKHYRRSSRASWRHGKHYRRNSRASGGHGKHYRRNSGASCGFETTLQT